MKKRLSVLKNYYQLIFVAITMLYCIPIFPKYSRIFNLVLCVLGVLFVLINIKKIKVRDFYLEIIFLAFVSLSIVCGKEEFFISNLDKLALCFLEVVVLLHFDKFSNNLDKNIKLIIKTQIGFSFVISVISLIWYLFKVHFYLFGFEMGNVGEDLVGFYTHPNTAGIIAAISIIFSYILYDANKNNKKLHAFLAVNVLLQLTIIVLAHSNASILIVVVYAFLELCSCYLNKRKINKKNSTVCASCFMFLPNMEGIASKLANGRFKLWGYGFEIINNHIWLGVSPAGVTSYAKYYAGITGPSRSIDDGGLHNSYIQLFAAVGVLGGIAALSLIVKNLIVGIRNNKQKSKYIFLCIAILIYNMMESRLFFQSSFVPIIFWIFLGYSASEE